MKSTAPTDPVTPAQVAEQSARLAAQLRELAGNLQWAPWRISPEALRQGQALLAQAIAAATELASAAVKADGVPDAKAPGVAPSPCTQGEGSGEGS